MRADKPRKKTPCPQAEAAKKKAAEAKGSAAKTRAKARAAKKGAQEQSADDFLVYFGPNRPYGLPVVNRQIFRGGIPAVCDAQLAANPSFAACFVPGTELSQALKDTRDNASPLAKAGRRVAKETLEQRRNAANGAK